MFSQTFARTATAPSDDDVRKSEREGNARASDDAGGERGERDDASNGDDDDVATEW